LRVDGNEHSISPQDLYAKLGSEAAPVVVDVRRAAAFAGADRILVPAFHRSPEEVERWRADLPSGRPVVAYCVHGHEVSQGVAAALRLAGIEASFLEGGIEGWIELGLPTRPLQPGSI
jgi:rhodanese-related sulfurtransferase